MRNRLAARARLVAAASSDHSLVWISPLVYPRTHVPLARNAGRISRCHAVCRRGDWTGSLDAKPRSGGSGRGVPLSTATGRRTKSAGDDPLFASLGSTPGTVANPSRSGLWVPPAFVRRLGGNGPPSGGTGRVFLIPRLLRAPPEGTPARGVSAGPPGSTPD